MNITTSFASPKYDFTNNGFTKGQEHKRIPAFFNANDTSVERKDQLSSLLKNINKKTIEKRDSKGRKVFQEESTYKTNGLLNTVTAKNQFEEQLSSTNSKYNYKDISGEIHQAKNTNSAGQVVIKARRAVLDLKKKIACTDDEDECEELRIALNHAKRMERVAKKKKHNLELEETVEHSSDAQNDSNNSDEELEGSSAANDLQGSLADLAEEEIFDALAELDRESGNFELQDDMPSDPADSLTEMFEEVSDEQREMLNEAMEMVESLEIVDPNMSEDDLKKLKSRHRHSEEKEIIKADMDYLKDMVKHLQISGALGSTTSVSAVPAYTPTDVCSASSINCFA